MGHILQVRTTGQKYQARCAARGCGFFYDAVDTDMARAEFSDAAKGAFSVWHAGSRAADEAFTRVHPPPRRPPPGFIGRQVA